MIAVLRNGAQAWKAMGRSAGTGGRVGEAPSAREIMKTMMRGSVNDLGSRGRCAPIKVDTLADGQWSTSTLSPHCGASLQKQPVGATQLAGEELRLPKTKTFQTAHASRVPISRQAARRLRKRPTTATAPSPKPMSTTLDGSGIATAAGEMVTCG
jgi:hypothetical protein